MIPLKIAEIDHIVLRCADRERALNFYIHVLGLIEERRLERLGLIQLRAGAGMIDLIPAESRDDAARNVEHFCLGIETDDMEIVMRHLRENAVEIVDGIGERYGARGMGPSLYIRDPEGNIVELKQIPPDER
ncbi:MAG: VOC family protein [Candidatus Binataceae bacterium]